MKDKSMNKPTPIIHTRVPADLQQVFIKANRGEVVDIPPQSLCRYWGEHRTNKDSKKIKKSTSFPDLMELDINPPRSPLSNAHVPTRLSISTTEGGDHYSDISSHGSTDDSTTFEHLEVLQGKQAAFSRWDAEYSHNKNDNKLPTFRRQGSFRWERTSVERGNGIPKMPIRH